MPIKKTSQFAKTYLDLSYQQFLSRRFPTYFRQFQQRRLKKHLKWVVSKSAYYRSLLTDPQAVDLANFPMMNKAVMMAQFDQLNTVQLTLGEAKEVGLKAELNRDFSPKIGNLSVGLSSGTTGNQGVFLVSDEETIQWSAAMLKKAINRRKFGKEPIVIAFFMRANNNLYESINQGKINLHFFDLLTPLADNLSKLDQLRPNVIVAQPSMLREIAHYYQDQTLTYEIKDIFSVAEVLEERDRQEIEAQLRCSLKEIYQATEGFLGISCHYGTLHLNEDIVFIEKEYIDQDSRRFVPIITDTYRKTQPLIRYRHTDILVERQDTCPCGSSFIALEKIEGREDDCFIFYHDSEKIVIFPDFIRYAITRVSEDIRQFKCEQLSVEEVSIVLDVVDLGDAETLRTAVSTNLKSLLPEALRPMVRISVVFEEILYDQKQKLRRVVSHLKGGL